MTTGRARDMESITVYKAFRSGTLHLRPGCGITRRTHLRHQAATLTRGQVAQMLAGDWHACGKCATRLEDK